MLVKKYLLNQRILRGNLWSSLRGLKSMSSLSKSLPSSPEMRSSDPWSNQGDGPNIDPSSSITRKVVGIARSLQENSQAPVSIDSQYTKRFSLGDSYDPFDFSNDKLDIERRENRMNSMNPNKVDRFERAGINPMDLYTMPEILSGFLTSTGQILPREITGCNAKNQKRLGMAIKRARSCGLLSSVHKHSRYLAQRNL